MSFNVTFLSNTLLNENSTLDVSVLSLVIVSGSFNLKASLRLPIQGSSQAVPE